MQDTCRIVNNLTAELVTSWHNNCVVRCVPPIHYTERTMKHITRRSLIATALFAASAAFTGGAGAAEPIKIGLSPRCRASPRSPAKPSRAG